MESVDDKSAVVKISDAADSDFSDIIAIAFATWPDTYGKILSSAQLIYMLDLFYNIDALQSNVANGQQFLVAKRGNQTVGFCAYENNYSDRNCTHIHKLYVLPQLQGQGVGKKFVAVIEFRARLQGSEYLSLNVNRSNDAKSFYIKMGFSVLEQVDIELGNGFLMEDFIMQKKLM